MRHFFSALYLSSNLGVKSPCPSDWQITVQELCRRHGLGLLGRQQKWFEPCPVGETCAQTRHLREMDRIPS